MALPRRILPGQTYLLTRRVFQRQFLLRPEKTINQIFLFCLAHAAERFNVLIHAYCVMSNHYHVVATDVLGNLPAFMHWLDAYVAKCTNAHRGRWESFWAPGSYSSVELIDADDLIAKLRYVFVNPVDAGLVRSARHWPGARSVPEDWARGALRVARPAVFFRQNGPLPTSVLLQVQAPVGLAPTVAAAVQLLRQEVDGAERTIRREHRLRGQGFLGRRRVLKQSPWRYPRGREPRRNLNPRVAGLDKWRRIESLQRLKRFVADYREAWQAYCDGNRRAVFPAGTYWMYVRFGVQCRGP